MTVFRFERLSESRWVFRQSANFSHKPMTTSVERLYSKLKIETVSTLMYNNGIDLGTSAVEMHQSRTRRKS